MDGTGRLFEPLVPFVSERFDVRVITYPPEMGGYEELERAVGAPPAGAILVGESFGGPLALRLAARHAVAGVVLVASFVRPPRRVFPPAWALHTFHPPPAAAIRFAMLERRSPASLVAAVQAAIAETPAATIARRMAAVAQLDVRRELRDVPLVTWLVASRDRLVAPRATRAAREARGNLVVETIDGPHLLAQSRPELVARAIERAAVGAERPSQA